MASQAKNGRMPRRQRPRWPFCGGRWVGRGHREVRVASPEVYRQRRRPQFPAPTARKEG